MLIIKEYFKMFSVKFICQSFEGHVLLDKKIFFGFQNGQFDSKKIENIQTFCVSFTLHSVV